MTFSEASVKSSKNDTPSVGSQSTEKTDSENNIW